MSTKDIYNNAEPTLLLQVSYGMEKGAEKAKTLIAYAGEKKRAKAEPTAEDAKVRLKSSLDLHIMIKY